MKDIRDPNHLFLIKVNRLKILSLTSTFILSHSNTIPNHPDQEPEPYYENGTYVDEWDANFVRLPCSQSYITVTELFSPTLFDEISSRKMEQNDGQ